VVGVAAYALAIAINRIVAGAPLGDVVEHVDDVAHHRIRTVRRRSSRLLTWL